MATDTTPPGLLSVLRLAISDPGSFTVRSHFAVLQQWEDESHWKARAAAIAVEPFLARPAEPGRDVIHDPERDWCACEPNGPRRCGYRLLADSVEEAFSPPDGEEAEVAILIGAVERARDLLRALPCSCTPEMIEDWDQCARCGALGQRGGKPVER